MGDIQTPAETRKKNINHDKDFNRKEQKSKLLLRNEVFLREWKKVSKGGSGHRGLSAEENWSEFIKRWRIDRSWDGRKETLAAHLSIRPEVYYRNSTLRKSWAIHVGPDSFERIISLSINPLNENTFIYIKVSPWTLKEDLVKLWPAIRRAKVRVFGREERAKRNFERDLYLFDVHKKGKLGYELIRRHWNLGVTKEERVNNRETIRFAISRIRSLIDSLTPI